QAAAVIAELVDRALALAGPSAASATVELRDVLIDAPRAHPGALPAVIGIENGAPAVVDLVADGPHAVVVGVTGSGKSELLTTWITALCATHPTSAVNFLLADFKGGTAFDALGELPHVTGVLTDLDEAGARRAIESLRAEIRWREGALTRAGARDILDDRVDLPRLVVVVDEFATLVGAQPELHAVFTDVAARGRALGMHLILGSQRATGVFRDALLANCPLRLSLRVTDAADSRFVIGTDDAARLPGGAEGRGFAFVRRAGDAVPRPVRVAMSAAADRARAADPGGSTGGSAAEVRRPWLPALPSRVDLEELSPAAGPRMQGIVLGLADEPESQRQMPLVFPAHERGLVIVGGAGSGRSTAVAGIAAQIAGGRQLWIGPDPESAWDAVNALAHRAPQQGSIVLIDDLDALLPYFPLDYAQTFAERLERVVRGAGDAGIQIVLTAQRLTGATARIAELLPRRAVLAMPSRADFVAAGGTSALFDRDAPRGRADIGGVAVQLAMPASTVPRAGAPTVAATPWHPRGPITGVVTRAGGSLRDLESELRRSDVDVIAVEDGASALESGEGSTVVLGDPESWQRGWRTLMAVRIDHDLVIDAQCAADYRVLTGDRELPPYAHPSRQRAWLLRPGESPHRVELPHSDQRW
ncbi:MAG: cell division protein FtsK, partial [Actinobacteria bacterium]|nr:cell division protein FtsK [Actinomycetota bacterium]